MGHLRQMEVMDIQRGMEKWICSSATSGLVETVNVLNPTNVRPC